MPSTLAEQKKENLLNISMQATEEEREKSIALNTGYNKEEKTWELIVKYNGAIAELETKYKDITVVRLINEYAILTVPEHLVDLIAAETMVEYVEKPKRLYFQLAFSKSVSCINSLQSGENNPNSLYGRNVIVGIIDTGISIESPEFRNPDGTTRILEIWDQTIIGTPPYNYKIGTTYSREQINQALKATSAQERRKLVPTSDIQGHGTSVAEIACGNSGVASKSDIIIVKMGLAGETSFPRTTQLMQAVDYVIRKGIDYQKPVSINLSFGNNYGNHNGSSLIETYLDDISNYWKTVICVGSGNEAGGATHTSGILDDNEEYIVEFAISEYELSISLQIWKSYWDEVDIELITPSGKTLGPILSTNKINRFYSEKTQILAYYGEPSPYSVMQEIFLDFIPTKDYIDSGIWKIVLIPKKIKNGNFNMWLPAIGAINVGTGFLNPNPSMTFTIPSTASKVISVGAYDAYNSSYSNFSGRGYVAQIGGETVVKPDIVAPGQNILLTGGGKSTRVTGTSFATPFVTGSAALLMEWGIVKGNDAFLYGEKCKAYLINGARKLPGFTEWPNPQMGWGALCVKDSIPF